MFKLKISGNIWYNHLSEYLINELYKTDPICPYVFIRKSKSGFTIITVYVSDMNLIRTLEKLLKDVEYLKREFKMKDLGRQNIIVACRSSIKQTKCLSINLLMLKKS